MIQQQRCQERGRVDSTVATLNETLVKMADYFNGQMLERKLIPKVSLPL
jgi:hypothetical protein